MEQAHFQAVITAIDRASIPLRLISANIRAVANPVRSLQGSFRGVAQEMQNLARVSGLRAIGEAAGVAHQRVRGLVGQVAGLVGPLGALGAVGSAGGLMSIMHGAAEAAGGLNDLYTRLGTATDAQRQTLMALRYSATQTGGTVEDVGAAMGRLNRVMAEARAGKNDDAAELFGRLRISLKDAKGNLLNAADILPRIAAAFEKNEDAGLRERMAKALFGKVGAAIIPAMVEFEENAKKFRQFGRVFSREDSDRLDEYGDQFDNLGIAVSGLRNAIGAQLAPVLIPLIKDMVAWVVANRELVAGEVKKFVTDLAGALRSVDWTRFWKGARATMDAVKGFSESVGGLRTVLAGFLLIAAGPLLLAVSGIALAFAKLAFALAANPIGAGIIAAAAALAYAGLKVWQNWDTIGPGFQKLAAGLRDSFGQMAAFLRDVVVQAFTSAADQVKAAWTSLAEFFTGIWERIARTFRENMPSLPTLPSIPRLPAAPEGQGTPAPGPRRGTLGGGVRGLYSPTSLTAPRAAGRIDVAVTFDGAPAGLRATARAAGAAPQPTLRVGYAMRGSRPVIA